MKIIPHKKSNYSCFYNLSTRWKDNDVYGHVNNVVYYEYFDTAVNMWLIENNLLDFKNGEIVGFIVKSGCDFISPISHPSNLCVGISASSIGTSSVTYRAAVFKINDETASAQGFFTHVYVNRVKQKASPIPQKFRDKLQRIHQP
ncbi:MAG: thioesterase [SAR116 cluster bacterium]|nr:thioesterase [SAR116 cluster bacterium]RPH09389.1 MAG: acyl-CoA thioesterase [Alphaproteobacteria bacterium TMED54]|tara:strand:- start:497 stop:931 length:435 start_codon:yes stop_codon:yes gene_type:complete